MVAREAVRIVENRFSSYKCNVPINPPRNIEKEKENVLCVRPQSVFHETTGQKHQLILKIIWFITIWLLNNTCLLHY